MNWINVTLVILFVATVGFYGIGLVFLGLLLWRIGTEMERSHRDVTNVTTEYPIYEKSEPDIVERFKLDEYSEETLVNGK